MDSEKDNVVMDILHWKFLMKTENLISKPKVNRRKLLGILDNDDVTE